MTPPPLSRLWSREPPAPIDDPPPQAGPSNSRFKMPKFKIEWGKRALMTQEPAVDGGMSPSGLYDEEQQPAEPSKSRLGKLKLKRRKREPLDVAEQEPPPFLAPDDFDDTHQPAAPAKSRFRAFRWGRAKRAPVDQVEAELPHIRPYAVDISRVGMGRSEPPPEEPPPIDHHGTDYAPSQFGMLHEPLVAPGSSGRLRNRKRSTASLGRTRKNRRRFPKLRHMDEESKIVEGHGFLRHASDQIHLHRRSLGSRVVSLDARWAELFTVAPVLKKLTKGRQKPDEWNENARQLLKDVEKTIRDAHRRSGGGGSILSFIRLGSIAGTIRPRIQPVPRRPVSHKPKTAPSSVAPSFYMPSERSELNHNISTRYPKNLRPKYGGSSSVMSLLTDDYPPSRAPLPSIVAHRRERQRPSPPKPSPRPAMAMIPEQGVPQMIPARGIPPMMTQHMSPPLPPTIPLINIFPPSGPPSLQSELRGTTHHSPDVGYNLPKPHHTSGSVKSRTYKAGTPEKMRRRSREKTRDRERPRDYPREKSDDYPREKRKTSDYPREKYRTSESRDYRDRDRERERDRDRHHRPRDRSRSRSRERSKTHRRDRSRSRERGPRDRSRSRERSSRHRSSRDRSRERRRSRSRDRHRSRRSSPHRRH
ncbi:hypothetical protein BDZ89DRAFT_1075405 [Hymenopellis radicata]|nr:hypothetical protein BDZ89DRAFT_1075405 [Hymenopellis radicata]